MWSRVEMEISIKVSEEIHASIFRAEVWKMRRKCYGYKKGMVLISNQKKLVGMHAPWCPWQAPHNRTNRNQQSWNGLLCEHEFQDILTKQPRLGPTTPIICSLTDTGGKTVQFDSEEKRNFLRNARTVWQFDTVRYPENSTINTSTERPSAVSTVHSNAVKLPVQFRCT